MKILLSVVHAILVSSFAQAGAETTAYGAFRHESSAPNALFLVDEISPSESFELRRAMRDHDIKIIVTASPGGNLYEGLQIAAIIQDNGIFTYVPESARCESSCANIFFGGKKRLVDGELGVHQFFSNSDLAQADAPQGISTAVAQYTTAEIIGIMNEFSTPAFVYEKMFGSAEIYYFNEVEKQKLNIDMGDVNFSTIVNSVNEAVSAFPELLHRHYNPLATDSGFLAPSAQTPIYPSNPTPEEAAIGMIVAINADWSLPNEAAFSRLPKYYGNIVNFYGSQMTKIEVLQEKNAFAERWPLRTYEVDLSATRVTCSGERCEVESLIYWRAASPERGKEASGTSTWNLVLQEYVDGYRIAAESGETIRRN